MALTNAERQARWQQRRKDKTQRLEAEILDLRQQLAQAQHENEVLRAQLDVGPRLSVEAIHSLGSCIRHVGGNGKPDVPSASATNHSNLAKGAVR